MSELAGETEPTAYGLPVVGSTAEPTALTRRGPHGHARLEDDARRADPALEPADAGARAGADTPLATDSSVDAAYAALPSFARG